VSRVNLSRIKRLEKAGKRLLDVTQLSDEELMAVIEKSLANDYGRDSEKYKNAMSAVRSDDPTLLDKLLAEIAE
jgi:hypothetical protein